MPLKVNVGLSKKVGQPDFGSLGASCHVELELDGTLLQHDLDGFHQRIRDAFVACRQAVNDQLVREGTTSPGHTNGNGNGRSSPEHTTHHRNGHSRQTQREPAPHRRGRRATVSQVRALHAIATRKRIDLAHELRQRYGLDRADDLSISDASALIDELQALATTDSGDSR